MRTVWLLCIAAVIVGGIGCGKPLAKPSAKLGEVSVNQKDGAEMVWVPAGEFTMGSTNEEAVAALKEWPEGVQKIGKAFLDAEKPQRKVNLDGYWMYKNEVTVAQYRKFCEATKRDMPGSPSWGWKDDHPMVMVTWQDAADYAEWVGVTLPTEAQWEKAARGTDGRIYPWGNTWDASKCASSSEKGLTSTKPVGSYAAGASPCGAMDMAGNVYEWCADWYDPNYYKNAPTKNPTGPSEAVKFTVPTLGDLSGARVMRGAFRCASGGCLTPDNRYRYLGFRCARTP